MRFIKFSGSTLAIVFTGLLLSLSMTYAVAVQAQQVAVSQPGAGDASMSAIEQHHLLRVGVAPNPPWVMQDKNGQWIGLEIDYVRQLAQDMDWKLKLVPTTWKDAIEGLRNDHFDMLAGGLSITPQRALLLSFSQGYGQFPMGLVVNRKKLGKVNLAQLEIGTNHRIGVLAGTVTEATTRAWLHNNQIVPVTDEARALVDVREGRLDGLLAEQPLPDAAAKSYPAQLRVLDTHSFGSTEHAFAVRRGNQALLDVINAWLVYQRTKGFIADREDFWLHSPDWIQLM